MMNTTMLAMSTGSNHAYCAGNDIARLPIVTSFKALAHGMMAGHPGKLKRFKSHYAARYVRTRG
jgi:hypothetical protein